jgi:hypothetical protein
MLLYFSLRYCQERVVKILIFNMQIISLKKRKFIFKDEKFLRFYLSKKYEI